jgi:hypothetical protein
MDQPPTRNNDRRINNPLSKETCIKALSSKTIQTLQGLRRIKEGAVIESDLMPWESQQT